MIISTITRSRRKLSKTRARATISPESSTSIFAAPSVAMPCNERPISPPESVHNMNEDGLESPAAQEPITKDETQAFSWPTGDPLRPSGTISFTLSPPPSPPLSPAKSSTLSLSRRRSMSPLKRDSKALTAIADWFQGESAPISLGVVPSQSNEDLKAVKDESMAFERWPSFLKRTPTLSGRPGSPSKSTRTSPVTGRFSMSAGNTNLRCSNFVAENDSADGLENTLMQLDVRQILTERPDDSLSSDAFDAVLNRADALLKQMQNAYCDSVVAARKARAEVAAQQEETEEAKTKVEHLRHQLNEMSIRTGEQDKVVVELAQALAEEKQARRSDSEPYHETIRLVGTTERLSRRKSDLSHVSDSGFESNDESVDHDFEVAELSLPLPPSGNTSLCSSPRIGCARRTSMTRASATIVNNNSVRSPIRPTRTQTAKETQTWTSTNSHLSDGQESGDYGDWNVNPAWGVRSLHEENALLRQRNAFLETELDAVREMIDALILPDVSA